MEMEGIIAAFIMVFFFSLMAPIRKELRDRGVESKVVAALTGFSAPAWILLAIVLSRYYDYDWSIAYFAVVISWVALVVMNISMVIYLYRYQGLTALNAYGLGFSVFFSLLADIFVFKLEFPLLSIVSFALFIIGGHLIGSKKERKNKIGIQKILLLLAASAILNAIFFSIYKVGLAMQANLLMHVAICQAFLHGFLLIYSFKPLKKNIRKGTIKLKHIAWISTCLIIGVFGEAYALKDLPISVVVMMTLIPMIVFAIYDSRKKELHWNYKTLAAIGLIVLGILLLR